LFVFLNRRRKTTKYWCVYLIGLHTGQPQGKRLNTELSVVLDTHAPIHVPVSVVTALSRHILVES